MITALIAYWLFSVQAIAGTPSLKPMVTVALPSGDQVTLYGDSEGDKVLYFMPARLALKKLQGKPMFNAYIYRGIKEVSISQALQDSYSGKLCGGYVDAILEVQGPTKGLDALKACLKQQYPQYASYRLTQVPLVPGSAAVTLYYVPGAEGPAAAFGGVSEGLQAQYQAMTSGGPVSSEFGGVIPVRFRLSELDALFMLETLRNARSMDAFTAAFDVRFSAETRIKFPPSKVEVTCNEKRVYEFVESHFKASGGFFFWAFSTDIRKIREKLVESGNLKIRITDEGYSQASADFLNGLADKWLEKFVLERMHAIKLDIPKARAEAADVKGKSFFGWGSLGTSYARVDIKQFIDKKASFSYQYEGTQSLPVHANAEFVGLGPANIVLADFNKSYFTYNTFAVLPFPPEVMLDGLFGNAELAFTIKTENGDTERRVAEFNAFQRGVYQTWAPLQLNMARDASSGAPYGQAVSEITFNFRYTGRTANFTIEGLKFEHSNWAFDIPSVSLSEFLGYTSFELQAPARLFEAFPNLSSLSLLIYPDGETGPAAKANLSPEHPVSSYFYDPRQSGGLAIEIQAAYRTSDGYVTRSNRKDIGPPPGRVDILESDIPGLLELGAAINR